MNRLTILFLVFLIVLASLLLALKEKVNSKNEFAIRNNYFLINDFTLINNPNKVFQDKIALIFFSTHCSLCSYELEQLKYVAYTEIDFLFCSLETKDSILRYIRNNDFEPAPNLIFAQIDSSLLKHKYQLKGYPSYFLYKDDSLVTYKSGILSDQKIRNVFYGEN